jgi:hypothetical protein
MRFMPTKNGEEGEERTIDQLKIGVKEAVVIGVFLVSHAVSWGVVVNGNSERDQKISSLNERVTKQEDAISRLMNEVVKVGRDTEWIRGYLNDNKNPTPR